MTKYLIQNGKVPLLLVDLDPDENLGETLGVSLEESGKKTISELVVETFLNNGGTTVGIPPSQRIESRIWEEGLYEGNVFDFMSIGPKWIEGCYCLPDSSLRRALEIMMKTYQYVLIDSPAGLEHLNRKITSDVDVFFDIIDPSKKSYEHVKRCLRIIKEVGIDFKKFQIVGGYRFPDKLKDLIEQEIGMQIIGKIAYDNKVEEYCLSGKSLLDLPLSSPAYLSTKIILSQSGL